MVYQRTAKEMKGCHKEQQRDEGVSLLS